MEPRLGTGIRRIARIDLEALRSNLERYVGQGRDAVLDARADAYGHGLETVLRCAMDAGVRRAVVSPGQEALARSLGAAVAPGGSDSWTGAYGADGDGAPVMTLVGEVVAVKPTEAGAGVSYGYTYRTSAPTTLALVALGYADGVPRLASNRARVSIGGALLPLVGRVAMDQFVVDCGSRPVRVGEDVVLFGAGAPSLAEWGQWTGRQPLEVAAGIGSRVSRVAS